VKRLVEKQRFLRPSVDTFTMTTRHHITSRTSAIRRQRPSSHEVYYLNPHISDLLSLCCAWTSFFWRLCCNFLSAPGRLDEANLLRCSLIVLACHHVDLQNESWVPPSTSYYLDMVNCLFLFLLLLSLADSTRSCHGDSTCDAIHSGSGIATSLCRVDYCACMETSFIDHWNDSHGSRVDCIGGVGALDTANCLSKHGAWMNAPLPGSLV